MKDMKEPQALSAISNHEVTERVIGCAIQIHRALGPGFLEVIYHGAMAHELRKAELFFEEEAAMQVMYDGVVLGDYFADFLVQRHVVVELKAVVALTTVHKIQLVNYLNAIRFDLGLLINFGGARIDVKRKCRKSIQKSSLHVPHVTPV